MRKKQLTKREKLDGREKDILDAAELAILKKGPEGFTMAKLAAKVKLAEGTLYLYFKNKQSIIHAVVTRYWNRSSIAARKEVESIEGCFAKMRALATFHVRLLIDNEVLLSLTVYDRKPGALESQSELELKREYVAVFDEIFKMGVATKVIAESVDLSMVRDLYFGTLTFMSRTIILHESYDNIDKAVDFLMTLVEFSCRGGIRTSSVEPIEQLAKLVDRIESVADELK